MKGWLPLVVAAAIAIAALGFSVLAQSDDPRSEAELLKQLAELKALRGISPNTASANWKPISHDVGLMLRQDDSGFVRARLYVLSGDEWEPVALDGYSDIAPDDLLLQR